MRNRVVGAGRGYMSSTIYLKSFGIGNRGGKAGGRDPNLVKGNIFWVKSKKGHQQKLRSPKKFLKTFEQKIHKDPFCFFRAFDPQFCEWEGPASERKGESPSPCQRDEMKGN